MSEKKENQKDCLECVYYYGDFGDGHTCRINGKSSENREPCRMFFDWNEAWKILEKFRWGK